MRTAAEILSALSANRAEFFKLVEELEAATGATVDESKLGGNIDAEYPGGRNIDQQGALKLLSGGKPFRVVH